ncbi:hypothetical protein HDU83_002519 [Entophlyctis luteolus]|nr:hypothetical protein HDU83_002519 [Entophlyctis luteolus]
MDNEEIEEVEFAALATADAAAYSTEAYTAHSSSSNSRPTNISGQRSAAGIGNTGKKKLHHQPREPNVNVSASSRRQGQLLHVPIAASVSATTSVAASASAAAPQQSPDQRPPPKKAWIPSHPRVDIPVVNSRSKRSAAVPSISSHASKNEAFISFLSPVPTTPSTPRNYAKDKLKHGRRGVRPRTSTSVFYAPEQPRQPPVQNNKNSGSPKDAKTPVPEEPSQNEYNAGNNRGTGLPREKRKGKQNSESAWIAPEQTERSPTSFVLHSKKSLDIGKSWIVTRVPIPVEDRNSHAKSKRSPFQESGKSSMESSPVKADSTPQTKQNRNKRQDDSANKNSPISQTREISNSKSSRHKTGVQENTAKRSPNARAHRNLFDDYMSITEVQKGLKSKTLFEGVIRMNKRSFFDAYVTVEGIDDDVYIPGKFKRNRAFDGDLVVVQILSGDELKNELYREGDEEAKKKKLEDDRRKLVMLDDEDMSVEELLDADTVVERRVYGKVVYIKERKESAMVIGKLSVDNPNSPNKKKHADGESVDSSINLIWFHPCDLRLPFVLVAVENVPHEFLKSPKAYDDTLWKLSITKWPSYSQYPYGKVWGMMGQIGDISVATDSLLLENNIVWSDFSEEVLECLPKTPWEIPQSEYSIRRDFRSARVFSIDPLTARDLDDALSIAPLSDGYFEIAVHIADVSHFVQKDTALDKEAYKRATTVYLVQKVRIPRFIPHSSIFAEAIPMLPRLLCEELCSLNPGVERLAFSIVWKMDVEGNIAGEPWFGKSIIKSCAKLSYEHAQALISGTDMGHLQALTVDSPHTIEDIRADTLKLHQISLKLRERRYASGALSINNFKLWFALDSFGNPINTGVYELQESNRLIEEYMLLANMAVADKIAVAFPGSAILRRHEAPKSRPLRVFLEFAAAIGYPLDASTSKAFQAAFNEIQNADVEIVLRQLAVKTMQRAKYFCTGALDAQKWSHYALNVPVYTHFTSPIRRYCDLVVHRQLEQALTASGDVEYTTADVEKIAGRCNDRKSASKDAQDSSQKLYLATYLSTLSAVPNIGCSLALAACDVNSATSASRKGLRGILVEALVYRIAARCVDVVVDHYGLERRVWIEPSPALRGLRFDQNRTRTREKLIIKLAEEPDDQPGPVREDGNASQSAECLRVFWNSILALEGADADVDEASAAVAALSVGSPDAVSTATNGGGDSELQGGPIFASAATVVEQQIRIFDRIIVAVVPRMDRSPPDIQAFLIHPKVASDRRNSINPSGIAAFVANGTAAVSCPAVEDEVH